MPLEFRVRCQREGRGQVTWIYQSWSAAYNRYVKIKCWDEAKVGTRFDNMPDLEYVVLESREVPAWAEHDFQPEITDFHRKRTRDGILEWEPEPADAPKFEVPF